MAGVTETKVVQVTLLDSEGYSSSLNIDDPKTNLSLNTIKDTFATAISEGWLYNSKGRKIVGVDKATYSQSIKTPINGGEVSATPSSLNITTGNSGTVNISGATPTSAIVVDSTVVATSGTGNFLWRNSEIDGQVVTIKFTTNGTGSIHFEGNATLQIWFGADKIDIPITVNITVMG